MIVNDVQTHTTPSLWQTTLDVHYEAGDRIGGQIKNCENPFPLATAILCVSQDPISQK